MIVHVYRNESSSKSVVPDEASVMRRGTAPAGLSTPAATTGLRLPAVYSMRTRRASSLPENQRVPYSSMYRSPLGPNSMSIGLLNLWLCMNRSMDAMSPFASMVTAMIQPRIHS